MGRHGDGERAVSHADTRACALRAAQHQLHQHDATARAKVARFERRKLASQVKLDRRWRRSVLRPRGALSAVSHARACSCTFTARTHGLALALSVDSQQAPSARMQLSRSWRAATLS